MQLFYICFHDSNQNLSYNMKCLTECFLTETVHNVNILQNAVEKVLDMDVVDKDRVVVIGGSHGGFLTAHLIGQFPVSSQMVLHRVCGKLCIEIVPINETYHTNIRVTYWNSEQVIVCTFVIIL